MWVEICNWISCCAFISSHPHGCVSWNTEVKIMEKFTVSHTLTGVWVEICYTGETFLVKLKSHPHGCVSWNVIYTASIYKACESHPHGCVSWNVLAIITRVLDFCHTLTGVWVEMNNSKQSLKHLSHTLTGVWVEISVTEFTSSFRASHPHGCVSWNLLWYVRESWTSSHPHGCVSWNILFIR